MGLLKISLIIFLSLNTSILSAQEGNDLSSGNSEPYLYLDQEIPNDGADRGELTASQEAISQSESPEEKQESHEAQEPDGATVQSEILPVENDN